MYDRSITTCNNSNTLSAENYCSVGISSKLAYSTNDSTGKLEKRSEMKSPGCWRR